MKALGIITALLLQITTVSAWALFAPDWARPVATANEVTMLKSEGSLQDIEISKVTMRQAFDEKLITSFVVTIDDMENQFTVFEQDHNSCGALTMIAQEWPLRAGGDYMVLTVQDYTAEICEIHRPHAWYGKIELFNNSGLPIGLIEFGANPQAVYTIQGHLPAMDTM